MDARSLGPDFQFNRASWAPRISGPTQAHPRVRSSLFSFDQREADPSTFSAGKTDSEEEQITKAVRGMTRIGLNRKRLYDATHKSPTPQSPVPDLRTGSACMRPHPVRAEDLTPEHPVKI